MTTKMQKQIELLSGVRSLGLFAEGSDYFEIFAHRYDEELVLAQQVWLGRAVLTYSGETLISMLWRALLEDHLKLEDQGFEDLNALVLAIFQSGCRSGIQSF